MTVKRMLALCAVVVVLCLTLGMMPDTVHAQTDTDASKAIDKDLATKKGVRNSLAGGKKDDDDDDLKPSKAQMVLGIGSFVVMIIVVKWL